jgi:hypothetical protein
MFFFTRLQFPRFSSTNHEALIEKMLVSPEIEGNNHKYKALLKLKRHAVNMANSFHQLTEISNSANIVILQALIEQAIQPTLSGQTVNPHEIRECLNFLKEDLGNEESSRKLISALFIFTNSLLTAVAVFGVVIFGVAMATSSGGIALLAGCMAIISTLVLMVAAYSLYVDGRNLLDKQIKEIETGVDFLIDEYPELIAQASETSDYPHYNY